MTLRSPIGNRITFALALALGAWACALTAIEASRGPGPPTFPILAFGVLSVAASVCWVRAFAGVAILNDQRLKLGYLTRTLVVSLDDVMQFTDGRWFGWSVVCVSVRDHAMRTLPIMSQPASSDVPAVVNELNE